ncbi:MAG: AAA family ATPase [Solirubrobacteraceae bacterium]
MDFTPEFFDPADTGGVRDAALGTTTFARDGSSYVYQDEIILALNAAMATRRPLLVAGAPGAGKSTLARNAALVLGRQYYTKVITSRTQARDLEWQFDAIRRFGDAQVAGAIGRLGESQVPERLAPRAAYVEPQVLWWSFDPATARLRGGGGHADVPEAIDPGEGSAEGRDAVVLLDEIDKAEPDVPNDLLVPLDLGRFDVELDDPFEVQRNRDVLLIITTNGERELPQAFIRRCVTLTLPDPTRDWLVTIADERFGSERHSFHEAVAETVMTLQAAAKERGIRQPSTAEFLDALEACAELNIDVGSDAWQEIQQALLWKSTDEPLPK